MKHSGRGNIKRGKYVGSRIDPNDNEREKHNGYANIDTRPRATSPTALLIRSPSRNAPTRSVSTVFCDKPHKSRSLDRHMKQTWNLFPSEMDEYIQTWRDDCSCSCVKLRDTGVAVTRVGTAVQISDS